MSSLSSQALTEQLLEALGGPSNLSALENCMTRLRVTFVDKNKANMAAIGKISGVMRVIEDGNNLQIVMSPDTIQKIAKHLKEVPGYSEAEEAPDKPIMTKKAATGLMAKLSDTFTPIIPALIGSGLVAGIMKLAQGFGADANSQFMLALNIVGFSLFSYLIILVAMNAAKVFGGTPALGAIAGCIMLNASLSKLTLFGMELLPGRGGVIGALCAGALIALIEKYARKIAPKPLKVHLPPFLTVLVGGFIIIYALQPITGFLADIFIKIILGIFEVGGAIAGTIIAALYLPLVMTGMHHALTPVHLELIQNVGFSQLQTLNSMAGAGQVGAALALLLKFRQYNRIRNNIKGGMPVGIMGIGEPLIYGVTMPLGRPFICACLGAAAGGCYAGIVGLGAKGVYVSGILGVIIANQPVNYIIAYLLACVVGFILTWFVPVKEKNLNALERSAG